MTHIKYRLKPLWHLTGYIDRSTGRPLCISVKPHSILLRLKGTRQVLDLPLGIAYVKAAWIKATLLQAEKAAARKARRMAKC